MHHANLLIGTLSESLKQINEADRKIGLDVLMYEYEKFGISEARTLKRESSLKSVEREYRVFIVSIQNITVEAQNALLKLFEEPAGVRFYVVAPREDMFIPTLRSRFMLLESRESVERETLDADTFLKSSYAERLELVSSHAKSKDNGWFEDVLNGVEEHIQNTRKEALKDLLFVRKYDRGRSASKKMLLEHLALSL